MAEKSEREATIRVAPHSDGSGYGATVLAYLDGAEPKLEIQMPYNISIEHWPALRQAVEDAIALVQPLPPAPNGE